VTLGPLFWLDRRITVNRVRTILHQPRRLVPWLLVVGWFALSVQGRLLFGGSGRIPASPGPGTEQLGFLAAALLPGAVLLALGFALWRGGRGAPATFSSAADARFIIGAGMPSRLVLGWLCLRTTRRVVFMAVFYLVVFGFTYGRVIGVAPARAFGGACAVALLSGMFFASRLAVFTVARDFDTDLGRLVGALLAAVGAVSTASGVATIVGYGGLPAAAATVLSGLPPGAWIVAVFSGDLTALALLAATVIGLAGLAVWRGDDCYPELWTASTTFFALRRMARAGGGGGVLSYRRARQALRAETAAAGRPVDSNSGARVPGGLWAVAWKEWVSLRRSPGGLPLQALILAGAVVGGALLNYGHRPRHGAGTFLAAEIAAVTLMITGFASVRMGADLRNPLWWLSSSRLGARLVAWTGFRAARFALPVAAFLVAFFLSITASPLLVVAVAAMVLLVAWFVQVIGLAAYSIFPAAADRRLTQMVRLFTLYAGLVPVGIAVLPGVLLHSLLVAVTGCSLALLAEGAGLVAFAAWRIQSNGIALAREERQ
jgi:hypothetical protein